MCRAICSRLLINAHAVGSPSAQALGSASVTSWEALGTALHKSPGVLEKTKTDCYVTSSTVCNNFACTLQKCISTIHSPCALPYLTTRLGARECSGIASRAAAHAYRGEP